MTHTHTYALMGVSRATYREIAAKMREAGYGHAFHVEGSRYAIDMHGIAIICAEPERRLAQRRKTPATSKAPTRRMFPDRRKA